MKSGCDEIYERRFVADFSLAKEFRRRDVTAPAIELAGLLQSLRQRIGVADTVQAVEPASGHGPVA